MRRLTIAATIVGLAAPLWIFAFAADVRAGTISIDFEGFSDGANLCGVNLGGVTLTNPSRNVEVYDNRFGVGYHSGTKAIASPDGLASVNPLVGVFDTAVSYVSLWGGDEGWSATEIDSWELLAYDARVGGNVVGRVGSGSWSGAPYRRLNISAATIWRFEAVWTGPQFGIGYDDLVFVTVPPAPEPEPQPEPEPEPEPDPVPSNGSFDDDTDRDVLSVAFKELYVGQKTDSLGFSIWNLSSGALTADLDLIKVVGSGDTDVISTNLALFSGLDPSSARNFMANIDTSKPGKYSATYTLSVTDATGTPQAPLKIVFTGVVVPEPSTVVLAAVGLLSFVCWRRRKRRAG